MHILESPREDRFNEYKLSKLLELNTGHGNQWCGDIEKWMLSNLESDKFCASDFEKEKNETDLRNVREQKIWMVQITCKIKFTSPSF